MVPEGPELIVVFGGVVSTVKLREAGVWSVFPTASVARTSKVWSPSASELSRTSARCSSAQSDSWFESRRHSKLEWAPRRRR